MSNGLFLTRPPILSKNQIFNLLCFGYALIIQWHNHTFLSWTLPVLLITQCQHKCFSQAHPMWEIVVAFMFTAYWVNMETCNCRKWWYVVTVFTKGFWKFNVHRNMIEHAYDRWDTFMWQICTILQWQFDHCWLKRGLQMYFKKIVWPCL